MYILFPMILITIPIDDDGSKGFLSSVSNVLKIAQYFAHYLGKDLYSNYLKNAYMTKQNQKKKISYHVSC